MNRIWNSIVGKLWGTIILLVSFILFIVTALLLEFLGNFHREQAVERLLREAAVIGNVAVEQEDHPLMVSIVDNILADETNALITDEQGVIIHSFHNGLNQQQFEKKILSNQALAASQKEDMYVSKELIMPSLTDEEMMEKYIVLADHFEGINGVSGTVYIYQSMEAIDSTMKRTTNIVLISAFMAFVLTTFFAFFLSTRITLPLRKMREAANKLSEGNFDTQLPSTQNDEIGQLAMAFNQMGKQLKYTVELISQEKEQLSSILTSMTDAVITFNRDGTILLSNPQAEKLLQKWYFTTGTKTEASIPPEIGHMLEHSLIFSEEVEEELSLNGSFYLITISPLYSENGIRGAVVVLRDMTDQHQLEKLRSDFIANVSHELRTPISMLQGYSEAILDGVTQNDEERYEMVQIIHEESERMGRLVTDLLDLARMESGHVTLYRDDVDLVSFLERMVTKFTQAAKDANVHLLFQAEMNQLFSSIDEDKMEQVFTNLIDNAIRHTPDQGQVVVSISEEYTSAVLKVIDTGYGIPEEDIPYIFERFYKADKARTRGKGGTGLGLAIAKNIVDAHGGTISVQRSQQGGTVMCVTLPVEET